MPGNERRPERRPGATETFGGVKVIMPRIPDSAPHLIAVAGC